MKSDNCRKALFIVILSLMVSGIEASAQQQKQDGPDIYEQAEAEADRLQRILDLDDWQVFYVDSTLKHDYPAMMAEFDELRASKVSNTDIFQGVQDKWWDRIDASYKRIFTEEQWKAYLKTGAGKAQKAREKRRSKN
ncbi:MAG: hypothetical protein IJ394_02190 [Bacteroidales bacterium]|nr:hypothetical protein [Bacteroidales bacterium]